MLNQNKQTFIHRTKTLKTRKKYLTLLFCLISVKQKAIVKKKQRRISNPKGVLCVAKQLKNIKKVKTFPSYE